MIDFGDGPVEAALFPWGDVFTAYYSTGIPNVEDYMVLSRQIRRAMQAMSALRPLFRLRLVRGFAKRGAPAGATVEQRARTRTSVWGEVKDDQGRQAVSRLHGPEAGVNWTSMTALAAVQKVLDGQAPPGFQTPSLAYGPDFVLEDEGVTREDL